MCSTLCSTTALEILVLNFRSKLSNGQISAKSVAKSRFFEKSSFLEETNHKIRLHREETLDQYLLELKFFVFSKNAKLSFLDMNSVTTLKIMISEILKNLIFEKIFENFALFVKNHVI